MLIDADNEANRDANDFSAEELFDAILTKAGENPHITQNFLMV